MMASNLQFCLASFATYYCERIRLLSIKNNAAGQVLLDLVEVPVLAQDISQPTA